MTSPLYWLSFALLCAYLAIIIRAYRITRRTEYRQSLTSKLAPYHGANLTPNPHIPIDYRNPATIRRAYTQLRKQTSPATHARIDAIERDHIRTAAFLRLHEVVHPFATHDIDDVVNVVELHPGHSVKVG